VVAVFEDDGEGFHVVGFGFFTGFIEFVGFGRDALGKGHEVFESLVAVVSVEVSEIGEGAAVIEADVLEDLGHPGAVGREAAVVFDDHVDFVVFGEVGERGQAFDAVDRFFVLIFAFATGINTNGVAAEEFGGFDPAFVIVDGFLAAFFCSGADIAFAIDHDEDVVHAEVGDALLEFAEVGHVLGFVLEEAVDVFEGVDPVGFFGVGGPVHVFHFASAEGAVVGPLGEGNIEEVFRFLGAGVFAVVIGKSRGGEGGKSGVNKVSALHDGEFRSGRGRWKGESCPAMSITTKRGDGGFTDLLFGGKLAKGDAQIEALGAVDELNATLGLARVAMEGEAAEAIDRIQNWLVILMGELAMPAGKESEYEKAGFGRIGEEEIGWVEAWGAEIEGEKKFKGWLRPGAEGGELAARLHVARTVARRAERRVWMVTDEVVGPKVRIFLNRLSDVLWLMAQK